MVLLHYLLNALHGAHSEVQTKYELHPVPVSLHIVSGSHPVPV